MSHLANSICLIACFLVTEASAQTYILKSSAAQKIRAVNTFHIDYGTTVITQWEAIAAKAPLLPGQTGAKTTIKPHGKAVRESGPLRRTVLSTGVISGNASPIRYSVTYEAILHSRKLVPSSHNRQRPEVRGLPQQERRRGLRSDDHFYDFNNSSFQGWLDSSRLRKTDTETEVAFAKRVFKLIKSKYEYGADQNAKQNASSICKTGTAHCGAQSTLFVSTLRANNIPARSLIGKWAQSMTPGETVGNYQFAQQHVKAEFYANGIGWVPVDQSLGIFGEDPGDFVVFQVDYNFDYQTAGFGRQTAPWFWHSVYVLAEGELGQPQRTEEWRVEKHE